MPPRFRLKEPKCRLPILQLWPIYQGTLISRANLLFIRADLVTFRDVVGHVNVDVEASRREHHCFKSRRGGVGSRQLRVRCGLGGRVEHRAASSCITLADLVVKLQQRSISLFVDVAIAD